MENSGLIASPLRANQPPAEIISAESVLARIKRLIARQQLQDVLGVSHPTMVEWEKTGKLPPSIRLGRSFFYDPADVHAWLEAQRLRGQQVSAGE